MDTTYEVLARKWRPQQFDDVVGQGHVTQTLKNAIAADRIAHAYLFVGPRGIGKTSIARIFAKALNCAKGPTGTPCGVCDACIEITAGRSLDVMEIDGASNNGVDQVRDLRDSVKYAPMRGKYKIYIIDEVHMLSTAAFNALLKTLEEPPPYVKFMFATTEPDKVLPTIVSRCQRFDLRRIPSPQIVERLALIAKAEKVTVDDDALLAIARGAEGGLRDAESALDQLIAFRGKRITEADVLSVFGLASRAALEDLAGRILAGDVGGVIETVARLDEAGKDVPRLTSELMNHFRNLMVVRHVDAATLGQELTDSQVEALRRQAEGTDTDALLRVADILQQAEERMRFALSKRTLLETALIRCARASTVASLSDILRQINELRQAGGSDPAAPSPKAAPALAVRESPAGVPEVTRFASPAADLAKLREHWPAMVEKAAQFSVLARAALTDAGAIAVEGDKVVLALDPEFEKGKSTGGPKTLRAIEMAITGVLGRKVTVEFKAGAGQTSPGGSVVGQPLAAPAGAAKDRRDWSHDPAARKALDIFGGSIVEVRD